MTLVVMMGLAAGTSIVRAVDRARLVAGLAGGDRLRRLDAATNGSGPERSPSWDACSPPAGIAGVLVVGEVVRGAGSAGCGERRVRREQTR